MAGDLSHSTLRPKGYLVITDAEAGVIQRETLQCCHCAAHFMVTPGSGKVRGFCLRCSQVTCGRPQCDPCVPQEQWLENVERGRPEDFRPIVASVPDLVLGH